MTASQIIEFFVKLWDWMSLANIADVLSIVGVLVSLKVLSSLSTLRKKASLKSQTSKIAKQLRDHCQSLSDHMSTTNIDNDAARLLLRSIFTDLKWWTRIFPKSLLESIKLTNKSIKRSLKQENLQRTNIRKVYENLTDFERGFINHQQEEKFDLKP